MSARDRPALAAARPAGPADPRVRRGFRNIWPVGDGAGGVGYAVFAVNPLQAARYRDRHAVSGAKSDTGDAHVLADMVRTDAHQLRPVAADTEEVQAVKVVARA